MALLISRAILHIINNTGAQSHFSNQELDVDSETIIEFVGKHVRRLMNNPSAREATFSAESEAYSLVKAYQKGDIYFKDMSMSLCQRLEAIMDENKDITPADILVVAFENGKNSYLAVLKLSYSECFTHQIIEGESGIENRIIKNTAVLPISGSKVEEACLIPYDPMVLRVLEKPYMINGEETLYFSKLFLECETEMSKKEAADILKEISEEVNAKYFDESVELAAKLKSEIINEADIAGDDALDIDNVAKRVFSENEEAKAEFVQLAREYGLPNDLKLDKSFVQRTFKTQTFKADNGIEIKFPAELSSDPDVMQFSANSDGTFSITLKNLRRNAQ